MTDIRALALAKGLTEHQADVAVTLVDLVKMAAAVYRTLGRLYADTADTQVTPTDRLVYGAINGLWGALSAQVDGLRLSLSTGRARDLEKLIRRLDVATEGPASGSILADIIEFCRTAPALKPVPPTKIRHAGSPPVTIVPYWQGASDAFWPAGVVL